MTEPNPPQPDGDEHAQDGTPVDDPDVPKILPASDWPELTIPPSARTVHNVVQRSRKIT